MKTLATLCLLIALVSLPVTALEPGDMLLGIPVLAKTILPLTFIPSMFGDSDNILPGALAISVLSVPNAMLAYNVLTGNPTGTRRWRKVVRITDGAAFVALAGYGAYILANSSAGDFSDIVGPLVLAASIPLGISFGLDFIPYSMEAAK
jgi:hypothetical protein